MSVSLKDAIANADYVLIGLGEEFNCIRDLRVDEQYESVRSALECNAKIHMLNYISYFFPIVAFVKFFFLIKVIRGYVFRIVN